jgi:hypothetical protein
MCDWPVDGDASGASSSTLFADACPWNMHCLYEGDDVERASVDTLLGLGWVTDKNPVDVAA